MMTYWNQRTVAKRVCCTGVGLHSGKPATLTLAPAAADAGITFVRMDLGVEIPARNEFVVDTTLSTSVARRRGARLDRRARARRAARAWASTTAASRWTGRRSRSSTAPPRRSSASSRRRASRCSAPAKRYLVIDQPVEVRDGDKLARLEPADGFLVEFTADFDHPLITNQSFRVALSDRTFEREVARARTFCFRADIERMQAAGPREGRQPRRTPSSSTSSRS